MSAAADKTLHKRRRLSPQARRAELLAAVEAVVIEHGFHGATVPQVVTAAGVAQGSFYRYFSELDEAFVELAQQVIAPIAAAGFALDLSKASSASEVQAELLGYYQVLAGQLAVRSALLREVLVAGMVARGRLGETLGAFLVAMRDHIRQLAEAQMGRPPFDAAEPDIAAAALVGMVLGACHEAVRMGARFDADRWARELARFETKLLCTSLPATAPAVAPQEGTPNRKPNKEPAREHPRKKHRSGN